MARTAEYVGKLKTTGAELVRFSCALDAEALAADGPHWIHILPHGPEVKARDGRAFSVESLERVVANTELPMLVDWEHRSEGDDTLASGWVEELRVEPASAGKKAGIWGRVEWTPKGREHVASKHYRFLSPVVMGRRSNDNRRQLSVEKLASVALTNRPALSMTGIDAYRAQLSMQFGAFVADQDEDIPMDLSKIIRAACGLDDKATEEQVGEALTKRLSASSASESLRAAVDTLTTERNAAQARVGELETELQSFRSVAFKREVEVFFDEGARAGKIVPANRDKWLEFALKSADNFATFKDVIYPGLQTIGTPQGPGGKPPKTKREKLSGKSPEGIDYDALSAIGLSDKEIRASMADVFKSKDAGPGDDDEDDDDDDDDGDTTDNENAPAPQGA